MMAGKGNPNGNRTKKCRDDSGERWESGLASGMRGESMKACPFKTYMPQARLEWLAGWRKGRGFFLNPRGAWGIGNSERPRHGVHDEGFDPIGLNE
jgi:ribosome modulation factor